MGGSARLQPLHVATHGLFRTAPRTRACGSAADAAVVRRGPRDDGAAPLADPVARQLAAAAGQQRGCEWRCGLRQVPGGCKGQRAKCDAVPMRRTDQRRLSGALSAGVLIMLQRPPPHIGASGSEDCAIASSGLRGLCWAVRRELIAPHWQCHGTVQLGGSHRNRHLRSRTPALPHWLEDPSSLQRSYAQGHSSQKISMRTVACASKLTKFSRLHPASLASPPCSLSWCAASRRPPHRPQRHQTPRPRQ